jgi:hypothetical protein
MRPGAGYFPTLALGRWRGAYTDTWAAARGAATARELQMTLVRATRWPAYRIYSEEQFFATELHSALEPLGRPARPESTRAGRLGALVALTGVVVAVMGAVALNAARFRSLGDRRLAGGGIARKPVRAVSQVQIVGARSGPRSLGTNGSGGRPRDVDGSGNRSLDPHLRARRRSRVGGALTNRAAHDADAASSPARVHISKRMSLVATTSGPPSASASSRRLPVAPASRPASGDTAATRASGGEAGSADAEFGFERR